MVAVYSDQLQSKESAVISVVLEKKFLSCFIYFTFPLIDIIAGVIIGEAFISLGSLSQHLQDYGRYR